MPRKKKPATEATVAGEKISGSFEPNPYSQKQPHEQGPVAPVLTAKRNGIIKFEKENA